jgi:hypothetical protein
MSLNKNNFILQALLLYIFFIPSAEWLGGQKAALVLLIIILGSYVIGNGRSLKINNMAMLLMPVLFVPIILSMLLNLDGVVLGDVFELARVGLYILIYVVAYNMGHDFKYEKLLVVAKIFIIFQFIFVLSQRFDVSVITGLMKVLWSDEGNWAFRNTGSFSNPNALGYYSIVASVVIIAYEKKSYFITRMVYAFIPLIIILLSGSRTSLAIYLGIIPFAFFRSGLFNRKTLGYISLFVCFFVLIAYNIYTKYLDEHAYMAEIAFAIESGQLSKIGSFAMRLSLWDNILNSLDGLDYVFGKGPGKGIGLRFIDNEYLALLSKYGLIGLLTSVFIYSYLLFYINSRTCSDYTKVFNLITASLIIFGITGESFTSWYYVLPLYFMAGLCTSVSCDRNGRNITVANHVHAR